MGDPLEKPRLLAKRVGEQAEKLGFEVVGFGVVPDPTGRSEDMVEITLRVTELAMKSQEERDLERQFGAITQGLQFSDDADDVTMTLKEQLKDWGLDD
jgi:hypothetical protein